MGQSLRDLLKKEDEIFLRAKEGGNKETRFSIQGVLGEGSSCVCYDAHRIDADGKRKLVKLKEFYPLRLRNGQSCAEALERLNKNQLAAKSGIDFSRDCQAFLDAKNLLDEVIAEDPRNEVLKNYIQTGEVLCGSVPMLSKRVPSVYLCFEGAKGQGFDMFLRQVRSHPEENADLRLRDILETVCTLADCVRALHSAGLMHLDIKPSNFLVLEDSQGNIDPSWISMFDINTICRPDRGSGKGTVGTIENRGTEGFRSPELAQGRAEYTSDIYSIGAVLFYAAVVSDAVPDGLYRDSLYQRIPQLVEGSGLIRNAKASSVLVRLLTKILKKCLAPRSRGRYEDCTALLRDLESARRAAKDQKPGKESRGEQGLSDPGIVIQKLLYDHPLYETVCPGSGEIRVLAVGSGTYGQKFMDHCLQAGQMKDYFLRVTAVSGDPSGDRETYLRERSALERFVDVDDGMEDNSRAYASLRFLSLNEACGQSKGDPLRFSRDKADMERNRRVVRDILSRAVKQNRPYHYIFIALGSSTLNSAIGKLFAEEAKQLGRQAVCPVCYVSERKRSGSGKGQTDMLYPVCVKELVTPETIDPQLEQMAFNAHIAWNSSLEMDQKAELEKFRGNEYHFSSSLAFALSLKYKLFSIGVLLQDSRHPLDPGRFEGMRIVGSPMEAAKYYDEEILAKRKNDPQAKEHYNALVALEHRRWVLDRVVQNWDIPKDKDGKLDLKQCLATGKAQNKANKTHACLLMSREDTPLRSEEYTRNGHQKWEDPKIDPKLDELDRMSLELHQLLRAKAQRFKEENPLRSGDMTDLERLISAGGAQVNRAFKQFQFCLKNILNGVESYSRQYDHYEAVLLDALEEVPEENQGKVCDKLELIRRDFGPVIEANIFRNYKAIDEVMLEKLPFILTYRIQSCLAMAFEDGKHQNGRNEAVFADVASATVLSPEKICYLYYYSRDTDLELLRSKITAVLNYLSKRKVRCTITFAVAVPREADEGTCAQLGKMFAALRAKNKAGSNAVLGDCQIISCGSKEQAMDQFLTYLKDENAGLYDGSTELFRSGLDNARFLRRIEEAKVPYFEFDWKYKEFTKQEGCGFLRYIHDDSCIRIRDMFSLMNAADIAFNLPEFAEDYGDLWKIYTGCYLKTNSFENGVANWNRLCGILSKFEENQAPLAVIPVRLSGFKKKLEYVLPAYAQKNVKCVLAKLAEYGVIDGRSTVSSRNSETCTVVLHTDHANEDTFNALFSGGERFLESGGVEVWLDPAGESVRIRENRMTVSGVNLNADGKGRHIYLYPLLKKLNEQHFISGLPMNLEDCSVVSFRYTSPRIKKLLTAGGEILEIYTYYQILNTGHFDDVACGFEFQWQNGDVRNELDIVVTKGFRSVILECKAVQKLELNYYHKLHSIAEHFGIGTTKVLVGNTYRKNDTQVLAANEMQRSRGDQLNIVTISEPADIIRIGEKLKELMER